MDDAHKRRVAVAYATATRAGDAQALAALSEPDAVVWHNHDDTEVSLERSGRTLRWLHRTVPDVAWHDVALSLTCDGFVWRAVITGTAPGGSLRVHTCVVVTLSDGGHVARTDEYLDAAALALLGAPGAVAGGSPGAGRGRR